MYTLDTVLAELSRKYLREKIPEKDVRHRIGVVQTVSHTLNVTSDLAINAAKAYFQLSERARKKRQASPSLFDGLVLGATWLVQGQVVTGDPHFEDLPETLWI